MMSRVGLLALFVAGAAGVAGPLDAQVAGLPVRNAGLGTGIGIAGDVGFPNADAGKGLALGATGALGVGPFGITASVSRDDPKAGNALWSVGGTANLKIFGGPLIPLAVTLQAGLARTTQESASGGGDGLSTRSWHAPVGLGLALTIPNPAFAIKPWVSPRIDVSSTRMADVSRSDANFGISGGVDLGFLSGLSIRAMYDRVMAGDGVNPSVLSVGLGFRVGK